VGRLVETVEPTIPSEVWFEPTRRRIWLHIVLFLLTFLTTTAVGVRFQRIFMRGSPAWVMGADLNPFAGLQHQPRLLLQGLPFSLTLLCILSIHELGHIIACRHYGIAASYPYFIPAPTMIGTMGAFIRIQSLFRTRKALFDVGMWGPLAGFFVAVLLLIAGVIMSRASHG